MVEEMTGDWRRDTVRFLGGAFKESEGKVIQVAAVKAYGAVEVYLHEFLTSALDEGEFSVSRPSRFAHRKELRCPLYGRWGVLQNRCGHSETRIDLPFRELNHHSSVFKPAV